MFNLRVRSFTKSNIRAGAWLGAVFLAALGGCRPGPVTPLPPAADSPPRRAAAHGFPRLGNQSQLCCRDVATEALFEQLHLWDLAIIDAEIINTMPEYLGPTGRIRTANPNTLIVTYFSGGDVNYSFGLPINAAYNGGVRPEWLLRDIYGTEIPLFELTSGEWTRALNPTTSVNEYLPRYLADAVLSRGLVDGVFYDWASTSISWLNRRRPPLHGPIDIDGDGLADPDTVVDQRWTEGYRRMLENSRREFGPGTLILGNGGWNTGTDYAEQLNGIMIEQFLEGEDAAPDTFGWAALMQTYAHYQRASREPRLSIIMANRDDETDFRFMRFALASTLMFDGYFIFTNRSVPGPAYQTARWYDEYAVDVVTGRAERALRAKGYLGLPRSGSYRADQPQVTLSDVLEQGGQADDAVWRRDFANGIVLVNPSHAEQTVKLGGIYRKILGIIDPAFNDGALLSALSLPARSGAILLRAPPDSTAR